MAANHDRPTRRCSEQTRAERRHGMTSAQRADLRGTGSSDEVFPATHKSGHKHGMAEFTTSLKSTPSTRAARGGEGSEWCWVQPDHTQPRAAREETCGREHVGQHVDGRTARRKATLESHGVPWRPECHDDRKRRTQALDKPRHHTAKDGVCGARGARLTHSQTATPEKVSTLKTADWVNMNRMDDPDDKKPEERTHSGQKRADRQLVKKSIANCRHEPHRTTVRQRTSAVTSSDFLEQKQHLWRCG